MSEGCWDHTNLMREVVGSVLGQEKEPQTIKKTNFPLERHKKGGITLLESAPQGKKLSQMKGWVRWSEWGHL